MNTKLTFETESDTSVLIMRDGTAIGKIWSEIQNGDFLPYPHDKENERCKNSIQICGFDNISEIWACGIFKGTKDCVISFNTTDTEYDKQQLKDYEEYVKSFFISRVKELKTSCETFNVSKIDVKEDLTKLQSFTDWRTHNF